MFYDSYLGQALIGAFLLAALAAFANTASGLLQRVANRRESGQRDMTWDHIMVIVRRPLWLLGFGAALCSMVLQAIALRFGSLASIEPILALELPLVVLGAGLFLHAKIGKKEWLSIAAMTVGTVGLILSLSPHERSGVVISPWVWFFAIGLTAAVIVVTFVVAHGFRNSQYRTAWLGVSTGVAMGLASAFLKGAALVYEQHGFVGALASWQLDLAIVTGLGSFWLLQIAFNAGRVVASQPGITLADPFVAIIWGAWVFQERMNSGLYILLAILAGAILSAGALVLAHSPALASDKD